ncbi:DUF192 domain-containing protein [Halomonas icarae]|uniref:DUF192 domain-containing protein n=1 Tax=Halomonas icarae TaxID=2691040 RepID=A0A7X4VZE2_9GAMM|nr:DUF192 domain-containing protein [Halomonas icarae]MDR5901954.1 DUF192 domain-containing protein [Halomonas icarae]NAW13144.1 DUF192 domain-containing protein [Halomonas icarae]
MKRFLIAAILAAAPLSLLSANAAENPATRWPITVDTRTGEHEFHAEVARTSAERSRGLMGRERLAEEGGMLFLYTSEQPGRSGFWMYNTLIPLDIAFIDGAGRIVSTHTMLPCGSDAPADCPVTRPGMPYRAALEVRGGAFRALGIGVGDCVAWPGHDTRCEQQ